MEYKNLRVSTRGKVCVIELSRPKYRNSYNEDMRVEIIHALQRCSRDPQIRAVVLTGDPAGKAFCAGADLAGGKLGGESSSSNLIDVPKGRKADSGTFRDGGGVAALAVMRCTKPVIAAMNGAAVGVGMTLSCACDMRVAAEDATVGFVFTRRGLACESISSWLLPRLIGLGKSQELVLTGRTFKPRDAPPGLFNYVLPADQVLDKALELANEVANNTSAMSVALSKVSLIRHANVTPEEAHLAESKVIWFTSHGADAKEGITSFLEKRAPKFEMDAFRDLPPFFPWWREVSTDSKL